MVNMFLHIVHDGDDRQEQRGSGLFLIQSTLINAIGSKLSRFASYHIVAYLFQISAAHQSENEPDEKVKLRCGGSLCCWHRNYVHSALPSDKKHGT